MFGRSNTYSCRKNGCIEFYHFMKTKTNKQTNEKKQILVKTKNLQQNFFKSVGAFGFCRDTAHQKLACANLDCIMAGFGWQLHYMLSRISMKFEG